MARTYKDSGIPWIGEIPQEWEICRLKDAGFLYGGLTGKAGDDFNVDENTTQPYLLYIPFTNIFNNSVINPNQLGKVKIDDGEKQNLAKKDDLFFLMSSEDYDGIGKPAILETDIENLGLNSFCKGFRITNKDFCPKFLFYHILSHFVREQIRQEAKGFTRINLRQDKLACVSIMQPPLSEQQRIAELLDRKCEEIDELIGLQGEFIEELKAYKQSLITETVIRGLNPNAKLKPSGIDWIGEIPQGWKCEKVKHIISSIKSGVSVNAEQIPATDEDLGVLKTSSVSSNFFIPTENKKVDVEEMGRVSCPVKADTIIVSRMNTPDLVGSAGYCNNNIPNLYLPDRLWQVETIKDRVSARYLWRFLISLSARYYYSSLSQGTSSSMQNISQSQFESAYVPVPPLWEQEQIADYLDKKCSEIDNLIAIKQQKIEELKDYKKSIIYEYVTGKREIK